MDRNAFEQLFREFHAQLTEFALGYVESVDEANDIVSDVFLSVWERGSEWKPESVRKYLYGAVRNLALTRLRNYRRRSEHDSLLAEDQLSGQAFEPGQLEKLEQQETADALDAIINSLPPQRRAVLMLRWREGMGFDEIASIMGTSSAAVQMQISRALKAVRERLPRSIIESD